MQRPPVWIASGNGPQSVHMSTPNCIDSSSDIVQTDGSSNAAGTPLVHFSESGAITRANPQDLRSGCRPERQPEHAPRLGAALRLPQAAALTGEAPALHARRGGGAARRAAGGAVDLLGGLPRA